MADNVTVPRYVRLQYAMTGKPLADRTKAELQEIADAARIDVGAKATADDLRAAIEGAMTPIVTRAEARAPESVNTEEENNADAD